MAAPPSFARPAGRSVWLIGPTLVLALLVGCTHAQKSGPAKSATLQTTAEPAPIKPAAQPPAKAAAATPAKDLPAKAEPPARKTVEAVPAAPAPERQWSLPQDRPMTDAERDALAAMIRAAAEEGQKHVAAEPPKPQPGAKPTTQPAAVAPGADKTHGCGAGGATAIDLNPPPPDKPQPKIECKQKKVVAEDVWQGKPAEFNFTLTNAGEGPLAIRIKKP
jgi:hypothetical protein